MLFTEMQFNYQVHHVTIRLKHIFSVFKKILACLFFIFPSSSFLVTIYCLCMEKLQPPPPPPHTHSLTPSSHPLNQSHAELKTVATSSPAFSRASSKLLVFILSSDWFLLTLTFDLTGRCDYFSLEFM